MRKMKDLITKENLAKIGNVTKNVCAVAIPVLGSIVFSDLGRELLDDIRYSGNVNYDDAVKVITNSDMFSSYKVEALSLLKKDGDAAYYKAVIGIIRSNSFASYKIEMMKKMNEK